MSPDYRYMLTRTFESGNGRMTFVMLNPSTATDTEDDPTIRRCKGFAAREGCQELAVVNLFGRRSTNPKTLPMFYRHGGNPSLGEEGAWHKTFAARSRFIVAAWGQQSGKVGRIVDDRVACLLEIATLHGRIMHCLGTTKGGHPRHPLYVRGDAPLVPWFCPPLDSSGAKRSAP